MRTKKVPVYITFRCPECGNEMSTELPTVLEIGCTEKYKHKRRRVVPMQKVETPGG